METRGRVLVTGGRGTLGGPVVKELQKQGYDVTVMSREAHPQSPNAVQGDITNPTTLPNALRGIDTVIHLASSLSQTSESENNRVTLGGTRKLLEAAKKGGSVKRIIYVSSTSVYGIPPKAYESGQLPIDETLPLHPKTPYGIAKMQAEELVRKFPELSPTILRPTSVLGPRVDKWTGLLLRIIEKKWLPSSLDPHATFNFTDVASFARFASLVLRTNETVGETYNVVDGVTTWGKLTKEYGYILGKRPFNARLVVPLVKAVGGGARIGEKVFPSLSPLGDLAGFLTTRRRYSNKKARDIGFTPTSLALNVKDTHKWYQEEQSSKR